MVHGKDMIILLIVGLIKKRHCIKMSQYFPTPLSHKENIKVETDLSYYATTKKYQ